MGREQRHQAGLHPARQPAAERVYRALQPHGALRLAGATAVRLDRAGAGIGHPLAMDLQPRSTETSGHDQRNTQAPLLAAAKNGGITEPTAECSYA